MYVCAVCDTYKQILVDITRLLHLSRYQSIHLYIYLSIDRSSISMYIFLWVSDSNPFAKVMICGPWFCTLHAISFSMGQGGKVGAGAGQPHSGFMFYGI